MTILYQDLFLTARILMG